MLDRVRVLWSQHAVVSPMLRISMTAPVCAGSGSWFSRTRMGASYANLFEEDHLPLTQHASFLA